MNDKTSSENEESNSMKIAETNSLKTTKSIEDLKKEKVDKLKAGIFFTFVTSFGILSGFGLSFSATKKREKSDLDSNELRNLYKLHDRGVDIAKKALIRATLFSVSGFSIICFGIWKLSGANTFDEFRYKVGQVLPRLSKSTDKKSRTEFSSLTDFLQFVIDEDRRKKTERASKKLQKSAEE